MKLIEYNSEFKKQLIEFNIHSYPNRTKIEERVEFCLSYCCKEFPVKIFLGIDEDKIIGQIFLLPFLIKNSDDVYYWGMDYFVHDDYRNTPIGIMLLRKVLKKHNHLGMAFSPLSLRIHKVLGEKQIADLKLFIKPNFGFVFSLFNKNCLPEIIKTQSETFNLVNRISHKEKRLDFGLIMRNEDFLKWRFNAFDDRVYYKYQNDNQNCYIVLRQVLLKKVRMLLVVDYRLSSYNEENFDMIDNLLAKVLKRTRCFGVLFYNSIPSFDTHLKSKFYFKFKNIPVLSNHPISNLLITPADSDFELNI